MTFIEVLHVTSCSRILPGSPARNYWRGVGATTEILSTLGVSLLIKDLCAAKVKESHYPSKK